MANDKKFIAKNGILTPNSAIIGTNTDNGTDSLQVVGSTLLSGATSVLSSTPSIPTIDVRNSGGFASNSVIARFQGDSDSIEIRNIAFGDYGIFNTQQNNGIIIYDGDGGVALQYNGGDRIVTNLSGNLFYGNTSIDGNRVLTVADEGAGNGLDADTIDGLQSTQFLRSDTSDTIFGDLTVSGNFNVTGTTTTVNTETILLADNIITLNSNYTGTNPTENSGFEVERGTLSNSSIIWDEATDTWKLISAGVDLGRIITQIDEGSGNSLDADTVDGLDSTQFLRSDVDDTATGNITVEGNLRIGNSSGAATISLDGSLITRAIYSDSGEIGFLNSSLNYAAYSDVNDNWIVGNNLSAIDVNASGNVNSIGNVDASVDVIAGRNLIANEAYATAFYDSVDNSFYGDFAGTSRVNSVILAGSIQNDSPSNTYIQFNTPDSWRVVTANTQRFLVSNTLVESSVNLSAPIFIDRNDPTFYGDFASTSRMNTIHLAGDIRHDGNTGTYLQFHNDNQFRIVTNNVERLEVTDSFTQSTTQLRAPFFVDTDNTAFFINPTATSELTNSNFSGFIAVDGTATVTGDIITRRIRTNNNQNISINAGEAYLYETGQTAEYVYINAEQGIQINSSQDNWDNANSGVNAWANRSVTTINYNGIVSPGQISSSTMRADIFYDNDTSFFINANSLSRINGLAMVGRLEHDGDADTYLNFSGENSFEIRTGGIQRLQVNDTFVQANNQMRAPVYYDSNDINYFINPQVAWRTDTGDIIQVYRSTWTTANTHTILRNAYNTALGDHLIIKAAGNGLTGHGAMVISDLGIAFGGLDQTEIVELNNNVITPLDSNWAILNSSYFQHNASIRAPIFADSDDTSFFLNPNSNVVSLNTNGELRTDHSVAITATDGLGNITPGVDGVRLSGFGMIGNRATLYITNAGGTVQIGTGNTHASQSAFTFSPTQNISVNPLYSSIYYDTQDSGRYLNPTGTTISLNVAGGIVAGETGDIDRANDTLVSGTTGGISLIPHNSLANQNTMLQVSGTSSGYALAYLNRIGQGTNPLSQSNRYLAFFNNGAPSASIRGDTAGNLYWINDAGGSHNIYDSSGNAIFVAESDGDVIVGRSSVRYATSDATPLIGSISSNKFHVSGSIQLNNDNDSIVVGRGITSSFLKDNELGFGQGGGFYMIDTTNILSRNGKNISTTGEVRANTFVSTNRTSRFIDLNTGGALEGNFQFASSSLSDLAYTTAGIELRESQYQSTLGSAPRISFHWAGVSAAQISMANNGRIEIRNNPGTGFEDLQARHLYSSINYDTDDTAFFTNPTAASRLRSLEVYSAQSDARMSVGRDASQRFELEVNDGPGFIRYYQDEGATSTESPGALNHSVNFEIVSTSVGANIFTFNRPIEVTGDITTTGEISSTTRLNNIDIVGRINSDGDNATYLEFNADDRFRVVTNGVENLVVDAGSISARTFVDLNTPSYYGDFAGISVMNQINIDSSIRHNGDTDTYIEFNAADTFRVVTGGVSRLDITNTSVSSGVDVVAPRFVDSANDIYYGDFAGTSRINQVDLVGRIRHNGDSDTYLEFNDQDTLRVVTGNVERLTVTNTLFNVATEIQAPIFKSNVNTAFFLEPDSTSILNTVRAGRIEINSVNRYIDSPSGQYGSIRVEGTSGGWAGYAIRDDWVFMSMDDSRCGIYNDTDNKWAAQFYRNAGVDLYHNAALQLQIQGGFVLANNQMRAPIYYDSNSTSFYLNPAAGNTNTALNINGKIVRTGFTDDNGDSNRLLESQNVNHWIWNTAVNWGMFWSTGLGGSGTASYSRFNATNPNELVFVGGGQVRASIDLDDGKAYFANQLSSRYVTLTSGRSDAIDNISVNPAYGSGGGSDLVLFDATQYFEKRVIHALEPSESEFTTDATEYVRANDGPFAGSYVLQSADRRTFYSEFIPVVPGETIYGEVSAKYISGTGGTLYYGVQRYDSEKRPIGTNQGTDFFVASNVDVTNPSWVTYRGTTTIPTTHTPFEGSDGVGVYYIRIRIEFNYQFGGAIRQFGGIQLKRQNVESSLIADDITATSISAPIVNAGISRDIDDTGYYVDPNNTNLSARLRGEMLIGPNSNGTGNYLQIGGNFKTQIGNGAYGSLSVTNGNLHLSAGAGRDTVINYFDGGNVNFGAGNNSDIHSRVTSSGLWHLGSNSASPHRLRVVGTAQASSDFRAPIFYDNDNTAFYTNPSGTSLMSTVNAGRIDLANQGDYITFFGNTDIGQSITSRNADGNTTDGWMRINSLGGLVVNLDSNNNGTDGTFRIGQHGGGDGSVSNLGIFDVFCDNNYVSTNSSFRAPIFFDSDNTSFFVNPAIGTISANFNGAIETPSTWIAGTGVSGYGENIRLRSASNGVSTIAFNADGTSGTPTSALLGYADRFEIRYNGVWTQQSRANRTDFNGQVRSPVYYDSDNTTYRLDGNGDTRLNRLDVDGLVELAGELRVANPQSYSSTTLSGLTNAPISINGLNSIADPDPLYLPLTHQRALHGGGYRTHVSTGIYKSTSLWGVGDTGWYMAIGDNDNFPTEAFKLTLGGYIENTTGNVKTSGSFRAPAFYDLDNTTYFLDPSNDTTSARLNGDIYMETADIHIKGTDGTSSPLGTAISEVGDSRSRILLESVYPELLLTSSGTNTNSHGATITLATQSTSNAAFRKWVIGQGHFDSNANILAFGYGENTVNSHGALGAGLVNADVLFYDGGRIDARGEIRSPIYYDDNNTTYNLNLTATSRLNEVRANQYYSDGWFRNYNSNSGLYNQATQVRWASDSVARFKIGTENTTSEIAFQTAGAVTRGLITTNTSNDIGLRNNVGDWRLRIFGGDYAQFDGSSIRSQMMFDTNDTSYLVNPSGPSVLNEVSARCLHDPTFNRFISPEGGLLYISDFTIGKLRINMPTATLNSGSKINFTLKVYYHGESNSYISTYNISGENLANWQNTMVSQNTGSINGVQSATRFGFGNDGTRNGVEFFDSTSYSNMSIYITDLQVSGLGADTAAWGKGWSIEIVPATSFFTGNTVLRNASLVKTSGNASRWAHDDYALRYYSQDNTAFYTDPSEKSNLSELRVNGRIEFTEWLRYSGSGNQGLIWESGSAAGMRLHPWNQQDMQIRTGSGNGGIRGTVGDDTPRGYVHWTSANEIGFLSNSRQWSLRVTDTGDATATSSLRAPIFFDSGDTAYYVNPASTSVLNTVNLQGRLQHNGDADTYLNFPANDQVEIFTGGTRKLYITNSAVQSDVSIIAPALVDIANNSYYTQPSGISRLNIIEPDIITTPYAGSDSGISPLDKPFSWGFQEVGAWSGNFPDLVFNYLTGMKFAANSQFEGFRFFDGTDANQTLRFQINGANGETLKYSWMKTDTTGIYSDTNSWSIEPNGSSSFGSMGIGGSKGGWNGITFTDVARRPHLMYDSFANGGLYSETDARWHLYYNHNNNCTSIAGATGSVNYELYVNGDIFASGNIVAFSDERKKENIETIDNALEKVLQLRGVTYNKIQSEREKELKDLGNRKELGLIAQEVEKIVPEAVYYADDVDEYGVNYQNMVGLLVESIKDQNELINNQQEQINELKEMVTKLMEKI